MHELSVCQALLRQVEALAREHGGAPVMAIELRIGPLSGVEPALLEHAFAIAKQGTLAEDARLVIERPPLTVRCLLCGRDSEATASRLACCHCGSHRTRLISGDEMLLTGIDLKEENTHV